MDWHVTTADFGSTHDLLQLGWSQQTPVERTGRLTSDIGNWGAPVYLGVVGSGTNSLTSPGLILRVITGPDIGESEPSTTRDRESWGFEAERIEVTGYSMGASTVPSLGLYDNVIAVLLANNDTVRAIAPTTGHPLSVLLWAPSTNPTFEYGPVLWTRCGAPPTATQYDAVQFLVPPGRAIVQSAPCPAGQALHIAVTNTGATARSVRLFVGSNRTNREYNLRVGFSFNANTTQLATVREQFRRAAWLFFGATGGSHVVRSYRFYNNSWCDAFQDTACDGQPCDVCVRLTSSGATCNQGNGRVWVDSTHNYTTIAHEFGHCLTRSGASNGLRDEYRSDVCPSGQRDRPTCPHSLMAGGNLAWNARNLCTDQNHWRTGVNWEIYTPGSVLEFRSQWDDNVACGQTWHDDPLWFPHQSAWTWLDGRTVASFPSGQTAHVLALEHFWSSTVLGRFDKLE